MFCIVNDKETFDIVWEKLITDQYVEPWADLDLQPLEIFNPNLILCEDLNLLYIDEEEGICGKVTFTHTSRHYKNIPLINSDQLDSYAAFIIKDVEYHVNGNSAIQEDPYSFEVLTNSFYKDILKTAIWICRKISLKQIITISDIKDNHEDLVFWGKFSFSAEWETPHGVLGIIILETLNHDLLSDDGTFAHGIKTESHLKLIRE